MSSVEPSGVSEGGSPSTLASDRPAPPAMPPWLLYWFTVASFGLYVPFWVYRLSGSYGGAERPVRIAWALGSLAPPVAAALLYEVNGPPHDEPPTPAAPATPRQALPALVLLALFVLCGFSPLRHFSLAPLFLLPIPFAWVQSTINRAGRPADLPPTLGAGARPGWQWAAASVGSLLVVAALWYEVPGFVRQLRKIEADAVVTSDSGRFEVVVPTQSWRRVEPGTLGDADSDLELTGPGAETWAVAYVRPRSETDLEAILAERRGMIFESGKPLDYRESRRFLAGSDFVPVSTADYEIDFGFGSVGVYVVLTAETDDEVIELIAYTAEPAAHLSELRQLVQSFTLRPPSAGAGEGP